MSDEEQPELSAEADDADRDPQAGAEEESDAADDADDAYADEDDAADEDDEPSSGTRAEPVKPVKKAAAKKAPAKKAPAKKAAPKKAAARTAIAKKTAAGAHSKRAAASAGLFSSYGLMSTIVGLIAVAALVFGFITWYQHDSDVKERAYRSRVLKTAGGWTNTLINLNAGNVEKGMELLRDKTVGELNSEFDAALAPYRDVVQRIESRSSGRVEAVAIETERSNPDDPDAPTVEQPSAPGRTDPVMVIATSVAENVGGRPQTVHWALHLDVTDVDGHLLISRLRSIR